MIDFAVDLIKKGGADGLVYRVYEKSKSVSSTLEGPERIIERVRDGIGILVIKDGKKAFVNTSDPTEENVKEAVKQALEMVDFTEPDDGNVVSDESTYEPLDGLFDESLEKVSLADLKELSLSMVEKAKNFDPKIKFIRSGGVDLSISEMEVATTKGVKKRVKIGAASAMLFCSAVDEKGGSMGIKWAVGRSLKELDPEGIAESAAEEAVKGLGAEVEKTGTYDIIFDPDAISMLFSYAFVPFSGEAVFKKSSFLKLEDIGKKLFSENVTLINDARNTKFIGAIPFDSEGTNTKTFNVVENGVLKSFLHSLYSAKKLGMNPTGNAFSRSFKSTPAISPVNLRFKANSTREEIFSSVQKGIYVTHMMGVHTLDPVSGRFSVQISGFLVENGEMKKPIRGMALSGELKELLSKVDLVGDDYKSGSAFVGSTLLVRSMSVGGK